MKIIDINGKERECLEISVDNEYPGFLKVKYASVNRPNHIYFEWYRKEEFIKNNPTLKHFAQSIADIKEDLGVVSKATENSLTDKTKNWQKNIFAGYPLWISRGKGEGQIRTILKNTQNTLIIDKEWELIPDKTSQYVISHNVHNPKILGNTLPQYEILKGIKFKNSKKNKKKK